MKEFYLSIVFLICSLLLVPFHSEANFFYQCGFDDPVENAQWTLRSNSNCLNKWIIGSADYNIGPSALYVWPGSGNSVGYTNSEGWITAFRTIVLPANELCDVTFDWKCLGDEGLDYAYVCWVTDTLQVIGSNSNTTIPNWVASTAKTVSSISANGKEMVKSSIWRSAKFTVMGTGKPAKLVFFWINDARTNFNPGAVIDNIMIKSTECSEPTDFNVITDDNNIILTWDSLINNCEVMYRNTEVNFDASFITIQNQSSPCTIPNLPKGRYSFWVRQVCDTSEYGYSSWVKDHNVLSIINDRCINFIDFTSPYVSATYGVYTNPYQNVGFVNFGQFSIDSRHTVNYTQDYDLRTNYGLKVIPDGSLVSVRLGNWDVYTKAETITYTYTVDSLASILLMKYAVVLQFPNHPAAKQPFFQLQILDGNDNLIDPNCGDFTFIPGTNTTDWNETNGVIWKDWTTIGLNLQAYRGRTIKIRLVTKDCADIGHYGYAYFTLDCAKAQLEGMTCGHIHADSICAPEGFIYHWYKNTDPYTIVSLDRCFLPQPGDTAEYTCRVVYPNNSGCSFNLSAVLAPRWPLASAMYRWAPIDCKNIVHFSNRSSVVTSMGKLNNDEPEKYYWDFGNGTTSTQKNPTVDFGSEGGEFEVTLVASLFNDNCMDTFKLNVSLPAIDTFYVNVVERICKKGSVFMNGVEYSETGIYVDTMQSIAGCDSIVTLDLMIVDKYEDFDTVSICEGESYIFNGLELTETGDYYAIFNTIIGCDSIVSLRLEVNPTMKIEWEQMGAICEDDASFNISYSTNGAIPTEYNLVFKDEAVNQGFIDVLGKELSETIIQIEMPEGVKAGVYQAEISFTDKRYNCGEYIVPMRFIVNYSKTVIKQLWNDVLGLKNIGYNGGYDFMTYQWYRNDSILPGETKANYYVSGGELDFNSYYQAYIVRSDGVELFTCPFYPQRLPDEINITPITVVNHQFLVEVPESGKVILYSQLGLLYCSYRLEAGANYLKAPNHQGVYLLHIEFDNGLVRNYYLIVNNNP